MTSPPRTIVGSEEWCGFPSIGIPAIKARVDSGAKTSSLHAFNILPFRRGGISWVSFEVHPLQHNRRVVVRCELPVVDKRSVKSSSGSSEKRYVVKVPIKINNETWDVELTLANRDSMGYRMLLGREAMSGRMLVDPAASHCLGVVSERELTQMYGASEKKLTGLKIGLLASNPKLFSNRRLMEAGVERGHEMFFINIKQCSIKLDTDTPEAYYRGGRILSDLDAIIPRIKPSVTYHGCAVTRHFENMDVFALNTSAAINVSRDKLLVLQLLLNKGLNIPTTGFATPSIDTNDLIDLVGGAPLIVKLLKNNQGRGAVLAETKKAAESVISTLKSLSAGLLVQEFIKEAQGKSLRCIVVDNRVVASIQREAAPGEFRASISKGGVATAIKITTEEKKIAIKAASTLGLKISGVDIIRSSRGPLLLDITATPGLEGIETATGIDIAGAMIASIEHGLGWKRALARDTLEPPSN